MKLSVDVAAVRLQRKLVSMDNGKFLFFIIFFLSMGAEAILLRLRLRLQLGPLNSK